MSETDPTAAAPVPPSLAVAATPPEPLAEAAAALDTAQQTVQEIASDLRSLEQGPSAGAVEAAPVSDATPLAEESGVFPAVRGAAADAPTASATPAPELRRLLAIEVPLIVQLGARRMTVAEVMRFAVGAIIEFNKSADEELELLANNRSIGKGQAVKVGENFGIKVSSIGSVKEMIRQLGNVG